jgi:hypothetical protein
MIASAVTCSSTNSILDANLWLVCISVTDWCIRQQCSDRMHVAWLAAAQKDIFGAGFSVCGLAKSKLITSENGDSFYFFFLERNSCIQVPPLYLFIWSSHSLRKSSTISLVNEIWLYVINIKVIPYKVIPSSFKYEPGDIMFVTYTPYFVNQIYGQTFS